MLEQKALAYANMYGVLGALENLCGLERIGHRGHRGRFYVLTGD